MALILDIETSPLPGIDGDYPEADRTPPATHKSPQAVAKWRENDRAAWAKDLGLSPRTGRIVAIGYATADAQPVVATTEHQSEAVMIAGVLQLMDQQRPLVTFNGGGFDLPFLFTRAAILGVRIPVRCGDYLRRYSVHPHIDLFGVLTNWGQPRKGDSLHGWARAFGVPVDDTTSGADVAWLVAAGDWQAITDHCASDVRITQALYHRLADAGRLS